MAAAHSADQARHNGAMFLRTPHLSPFAKPSLTAFASHGLRVLVGAAIVAFLMCFARGELSAWHFFHTLAYACSIALSSWAFIDFGRFFFHPDPESGWPTGFWGVLLPVIGCGLGFPVGEAMGDVLTGRDIYSGYTLGIRSLKADIVVSAGIGALFSGYYYFRARTAVHEARLARARDDLTLARLSLLQSQLEPHMLFNTLANLRVLIGIDPPRAQDMLDRMIAYLRATLDGSRAPLHTLAKEFERLSDYLSLMAIRMGPRLQVSLELPETLKHLQVPTLLLQPLVENSIKHGLEPQVAGGRITVSAAQTGDTLVLTVRDTGLGLSGTGAAVSASASSTSSDSSTKGSHFGVAQVHERLSTLYGTAARLTLSNAPDGEGGVIACIVLPLDPTPGAQP